MDELLDDAFFVVVLPVFESGKRAHTNQVAVAAHYGDGLEQVLALVAVHNDAAFGFQFPGALVHVEYNDVKPQVAGRFLSAQTGAQTVVEENEQYRAVAAPRFKTVAVGLDFAGFGQRGIERSDITYVQKTFHGHIFVLVDKCFGQARPGGAAGAARAGLVVFKSSKKCRNKVSSRLQKCTVSDIAARYVPFCRKKTGFRFAFSILSINFAADKIQTTGYIMKKMILMAAIALMAVCVPAGAQQVKNMKTDVQGDQVIEALAKEYKGEVVLVDFWATWCGPCRMAMKTVDTIKPELTKKGVKFVYVTGETSPKDTWDNMIKNIKGDHFRLTKAQWDKLCNSLNMRGIPSYLIIGKDGKVAYSNVTEGGYPGNEVLQDELQKALDAK